MLASKPGHEDSGQGAHLEASTAVRRDHACRVEPRCAARPARASGPLRGNRCCSGRADALDRARSRTCRAAPCGARHSHGDQGSGQRLPGRGAASRCLRGRRVRRAFARASRSRPERAAVFRKRQRRRDRRMAAVGAHVAFAAARGGSGRQSSRAVRAHGRCADRAGLPAPASAQCHQGAPALDFLRRARPPRNGEPPVHRGEREIIARE